VKELESKLNSLSAHSSNLLSDNEQLKLELQRLTAQNEILRATSAHTQLQQQQEEQQEGQAQLHAQQPRSPSPVHGPQTYSPTDFSAAVGLDAQEHSPGYNSYGGEEGQRLLGASATWDLIQSHDLCRRGMVDIADVSRRLKGKAACDGRGPAFRESEVIKAIEESVISGSDELI
jgi:AP-1-like factor